MTPPFTTYQKSVYRGHNPRWAYDPESGEGAKRHGGRFNPSGLSCLYTSQSPETAWLEAQQGFPFKAQPLTLCAYEVDCQHILDLTNTEVREAVTVELADIACPWEDVADLGGVPPSWRVSKKLISMGAAGVVAPSFASHATPNDVNVVFWDWSRRRPHRVRIIDDLRRLPKDDRSWR